MSDVQTFLAHHGVKGMKWGIRRSRIQLARARSNRANNDTSEKPAAPAPGSSKATSHLSNNELQALVTRMNLEQQFARLSAEQVPRPSEGRKFVKKLVTDIAKTQVTRVAKSAVDIAVENALGKAGAKTNDPFLTDLSSRIGPKQKGGGDKSKSSRPKAKSEKKKSDLKFPTDSKFSSSLVGTRPKATAPFTLHKRKVPKRSKSAPVYRVTTL